MVRKRLSRGLLLFALSTGSYSYAEHPTEPAKSDTFEETPQKPTTRAPSSSIRQYSASSAHVGVTVVPEPSSEGDANAEAGPTNAPSAVRSISAGRGAAVFSVKEENGVREYSVGPNRAVAQANAQPTGSMLPASLLVWLGLSRLASPMTAQRGLPFGRGLYSPLTPPSLAPSRDHGPLDAERVVFEPPEDRELGFSSSLWAW